MSRIGVQPVSLPSGVEVKVADGVVSVKGPKGTLQERLVNETQVEIVDGRVAVTREAESKQARAAIGVGYRAEAKGKKLTILIGFSHPVEIDVPEGLEVATEQPTRIMIRGASKQKVGQFAANVREVRPPEPYKGKGIRYVGEHVRRKVGKSAVGA